MLHNSIILSVMTDYLLLAPTNPEGETKRQNEIKLKTAGNPKNRT